MAENQIMVLLEKEKASIQAMLPESVGPDRWWALMVEVARSKDLQRIAQTNPGSLIAAVKKIADWGIDLDGEEAIIVPYGDEAVPQAMYKGLIRRAVEAGAVAHAVADIVKEGDEIIIETSSDGGRKLIHRPAFNLKAGKRPVVGAYALFTLPNGATDFELMDSDDLSKVKAAAERMAKRRNKDAGLSPAWQQFEGEMAKKSVLRRGLKRFRGRRDTDAGRRFADAALGTRFDAETTGEEISLPPDDLPNSTNPEKLVLKSDPAAVVPDRKIDATEMAGLDKEIKQRGLKMGRVVEILVEQFGGIDDLGDLMASQMPKFVEALG